MLWQKVSLQSPDKLFLVVRNSGNDVLTVGHGVVYDYRTNQGGANDGYSVRYAADFFTDGTNRNGLAGVVVGRPIYPGGYGSIQAWGHCDYIVVGGVTTGAGPWDTISVSVIADADLLDLYLQPADISYYVTTPGIFAVLLEANDKDRIAHPPTVQLLDAIIPWGATTYGTLAATSTGTTKGFVRCL